MKFVATFILNLSTRFASAAIPLVKASHVPIMKLGAPLEPVCRQSNHDSLDEINELQVREHKTFRIKAVFVSRCSFCVPTVTISRVNPLGVEVTSSVV